MPVRDLTFIFHEKMFNLNRESNREHFASYLKCTDHYTIRIPEQVKIS